jgi:hypothetical protein
MSNMNVITTGEGDVGRGPDFDAESEPQAVVAEEKGREEEERNDCRGPQHCRLPCSE